MSEGKLKLSRTLGTFDLAMLLIVAVVNLNLVPVAAAGGPSVMLLWVVALLFFFIPLAIAVMELSKLHPEEGGIYLWSKIYFGKFHGFMSGWCYWVNNIFYIPTLLFYLIGVSLFVFGGSTTLSDNVFFMTCSSLLLLFGFTSLNVVRSRTGKWVQNLGAIAVIITVIVLLVIAFVTLCSQGMANAITLKKFLPDEGMGHTLSVFGLLCFAFVGLELGSVMGDEIKEPQRNIRRAVLMAGICCAVLYMICTFALQISLPVADAGIISGFLQAAERIAANAGIPWIVSPFALLLSLSICGSINTWINGSARLPFSIGVDRYLPSQLGNIHWRYNTPHVALIAQGIVSGLVILLNGIGSNARDLYNILLNTAVVIQLIPFLYLFAALIKLQTATRTFKNKRAFIIRTLRFRIAGTIGFATTVMGILLALTPPGGVENVLAYEIKLLSGCVAFVLPAAFLFHRRNRNEEPVLVTSNALNNAAIKHRERIGI